jgi:hypothetical protein
VWDRASRGRSGASCVLERRPGRALPRPQAPVSARQPAPVSGVRPAPVSGRRPSTSSPTRELASRGRSGVAWMRPCDPCPPGAWHVRHARQPMYGLATRVSGPCGSPPGSASLRPSSHQPRPNGDGNLALSQESRPSAESHLSAGDGGARPQERPRDAPVPLSHDRCVCDRHALLRCASAQAAN